MNILRSIIPDGIINQGVDLRTLGINEYAWNRHTISEILKILEKYKIGIWGGDVFRVCNQEVESTYDSWYVDNVESDDFCTISHYITLDYIDTYEKKNRGVFLYTLTIEDSSDVV